MCSIDGLTDSLTVQEVEVYWRKLLEVCQVERLAVRCRIVVPENSMRLPGHMSLTSKLLASPRALTRIQLYCKGRLGYIVPGMLGPEEVRSNRRYTGLRHLHKALCSIRCSISLLYPRIPGYKPRYSVEMGQLIFWPS